MFDLGPEKLVIVLAVAFIMLGPRELPGAARRLGALMHQLRSLQDRVRSELHTALDTREVSPDTASNEQEPDPIPTVALPEHVGLPDTPATFQ
jgi:Sec-independent protein translocase protein TatA